MVTPPIPLAVWSGWMPAFLRLSRSAPNLSSSQVNGDSMWRSCTFNTLLESSAGGKVALRITDPAWAPFRTHHRNSISPLWAPSTPQGTGEEQPLCSWRCSSSWAAWSHRLQQRETPSLLRALLLEPAVPSQKPLLSLFRPFPPHLMIKANIKGFMRPLEPTSPAMSVLWQIQDALMCLCGLKEKRSRDYQESGNMATRVSLTLLIKAHILSMLHFSSKASRVLPQNAAIKQQVVKTNDISCVLLFWAIVLHKDKFSLTLKRICSTTSSHRERRKQNSFYQ